MQKDTIVSLVSALSCAVKIDQVSFVDAASMDANLATTVVSSAIDETQLIREKLVASSTEIAQLKEKLSHVDPGSSDAVYLMEKLASLDSSYAKDAALLRDRMNMAVDTYNREAELMRERQQMEAQMLAQQQYLEKVR